ncbi:MAG TPA: hypothetical protein VM715_05750 [Candidatus Acidoferrum sp.]|jgi:hypothetical protein|nr:hypothetical protein [Candidatus Acidoferrum sp.]
MTNIVVVNKSTLVKDSEVQLMTRACAHQLRYDAAPIWGLLPIPVTYHASEQTAPPGSWVIAVMDDSDQAGALGWHTEESGELIYGRVFARPVLEHGGDVLASDLSVASVLSHEVLETFVDPRCNLWADSGKGYAVAVEIGDPVEAEVYDVSVSRRTVTVSNFVTPDWFDPYANTHEKDFDYIGSVAKPFLMSTGGYTIVMQEGKVTQQFAREYPDWRKEAKKVDTARTARRLTSE